MSGSHVTLTEVWNPVWTTSAVREKVGESHCVCQNHKLTSHDFSSQRPTDFLFRGLGDLKIIICPPHEPHGQGSCLSDSLLVSPEPGEATGTQSFFRIYW